VYRFGHLSALCIATELLRLYAKVCRMCWSQARHERQVTQSHLFQGDTMYILFAPALTAVLTIAVIQLRDQFSFAKALRVQESSSTR
jgi:hypothetical protein